MENSTVDIIPFNIAMSNVETDEGHEGKLWSIDAYTMYLLLYPGLDFTERLPIFVNSETKETYTFSTWNERRGFLKRNTFVTTNKVTGNFFETMQNFQIPMGRAIQKARIQRRNYKPGRSDNRGRHYTKLDPNLWKYYNSLIKLFGEFKANLYHRDIGPISAIRNATYLLERLNKINNTPEAHERLNILYDLSRKHWFKTE